jgi:phosphoribosyl 1,2-cyclic phosphodiesterase
LSLITEPTIKNSNGLKISILASGSSGNSIYVETDTTKLLVDCGLTGKKTEGLLRQINRRPEDLDAILVSHEHSDHIHGVGVMSRKYNLDIYANEKTWQAMGKKLGKIKTEHKYLFNVDEFKTIGDIDILSFGISHDAVAPQFYAFQKNKKQFVILTDTGYVSDRMRDALRNADAYLIESNHDTSMLRMGKYPWHLKQRILSDKGHLSNEDGALAMTDMIGDKTKRIYLGHLSRENNMKELAYDTVEELLYRKDTGVNEQFYLYDTDPDEAQSLFTL